MANAAVFRILGEPCDKALIAPLQARSHVSHTMFGTLGALGIQHPVNEVMIEIKSSTRHYMLTPLTNLLG